VSAFASVKPPVPPADELRHVAEVRRVGGVGLGQLADRELVRHHVAVVEQRSSDRWSKPMQSMFAVCVAPFVVEIGASARTVFSAGFIDDSFRSREGLRAVGRRNRAFDGRGAQIVHDDVDALGGRRCRAGRAPRSAREHLDLDAAPEPEARGQIEAAEEQHHLVHQRRRSRSASPPRSRSGSPGTRRPDPRPACRRGCRRRSALRRSKTIVLRESRSRGTSLPEARNCATPAITLVRSDVVDLEKSRGPSRARCGSGRRWPGTSE
jgi:hypothetical protein